MIEKVNPSHPDKIADRIAGALVDLCYTKSDNPRCAFEVLIGHGNCYIIAETSEHLKWQEVADIVERIAGENVDTIYDEVAQDLNLSKNQADKVKAGDNGIFKGVPMRTEIKDLSSISREIYKQFPTDGKYILDGNRLIICQSNATKLGIENLINSIGDGYNTTVNPLGPWTGGTDVDTGATNRKLGSDMGDAVTGGGLHGKDLSKGDVSVNIYAHLQAQILNKTVEISCAIGDDTVDGKNYEDIVDIARDYIKLIGGFEKLAEWGLV